MLAQALERYPFDTVLVALGAVDRLVTGPESALLPVAQRHDTGVIAMKVYGHGHLQQRELALRYSLSLPGVSMAILGMDNEAQLEENVRLWGPGRGAMGGSLVLPYRRWGRPYWPQALLTKASFSRVWKVAPPSWWL